jgi:hypothetical protein
MSEDAGDDGQARIRAVHTQAMADGEDGYLDPATGLFVLTADFLARRGYCCGNGCRHCPYDNSTS